MLQRIYALYAMLAFILLFLIFFWPLLFPVFFPKRFKWVGIINRWWGRAIFASWLIRTRLEFRFKPDFDGQYIFCPNHFSYIDIPAMALNPHNTIFVGKHDMERIPLFGFMYSRLHITVDRSKLRSRYETFLRSAEAIDRGKSLVIFPEGGIVSNDGKHLARFKDGPFRLAAEKGVPVVPVTIPNGFNRMPDSPLTLRPGHLDLIFHEPIMPSGKDDKSIEDLKHRVFSVIDNELNYVFGRTNPSENSTLVQA